jgi:hypothetical protein
MVMHWHQRYMSVELDACCDTSVAALYELGQFERFFNCITLTRAANRRVGCCPFAHVSSTVLPRDLLMVTGEL